MPLCAPAEAQTRMNPERHRLPGNRCHRHLLPQLFYDYTIKLPRSHY